MSTMKAVAVTPGVAKSARLIQVPVPAPTADQVRVRMIRVGICGTDLEIDRAEYGQAPPGEEYLILCHENFGQVESVGANVKGVAPGDHVVAMVRRPDDCPNCCAGEQDMCIAGNYMERGIKGRHGFLSEYYVESPEYLIPIPPDLREVGVLLEPLTVVEKGIRHAWAAQGRMKAWSPKRALVLGAGPIGMMAAVVLRLRGLETIVYARDTSPVISERVAAIGARYIPQLDEKGEMINHIGELPKQCGAFDFILEATGAEQVALSAMRIIGLNGILCLTSVTGSEKPMEICAGCLNLELVLGNRSVFGSVNANRADFEQGVRDLAAARERWPGWLEGVITRRVPIDRFRESFERQPGDLKVVVEL
ncbi:glucose 1-dehydrogenase [Geobacter sp.]|uniref:glucose 1-dehydrogenase n=1 Tax=Geobacter sp. TaxID=46610 RepID=UPI0027BA41AE|nr:glucose 1-dehydrogenase [Geobacter sp.]